MSKSVHKNNYADKYLSDMPKNDILLHNESLKGKRKCMTCKRKFVSAGPNNRRCGKCKHGESFAIKRKQGDIESMSSVMETRMLVGLGAMAATSRRTRRD